MSLIVSTRWIALSQAFRIGGQLVSMTVLTRLLHPADYGLMAMATVVVNFAYIFRDLGTSGAMVQKRELKPGLVHSIFWFNLAFGLAVAVAMALSAGLVARYFAQPALAPILLLLATLFPVSAVGVVPQSLLERESRFDRVARAEILSSLLALALALVLAWQGAGVYALVAQSLAAAVLTTLLMWRAAGWRPELAWDGAEFKTIWAFSSDVSLFQLVNYSARNADAWIIGKLLGAADLGIYSLAYRIMLFPVQNLTWAAGRVLFPALSRRQEHPQEASHLYLKAVCTIAFITAPLMTGLWCLRSLFVDVVLGTKWEGVTPILAWLAPVGFIQSLVSTTGSVFLACGQTRLLLKLSVLGAVLMTTAFIVGAPRGIEGVAQAYFVANVLNALPALVLAAKAIGLPVRELADKLGRIIFFSLAMAAMVLGARNLLGEAISSALLLLALLVSVGVLGYGLLSALYLKDPLRWLLALVQGPKTR